MQIMIICVFDCETARWCTFFIASYIVLCTSLIMHTGFVVVVGRWIFAVVVYALAGEFVNCRGSEQDILRIRVELL